MTGQLSQRLVGLLREGSWTELTFAKTSGTVARNRENNWLIADRRQNTKTVYYFTFAIWADLTFAETSGTVTEQVTGQ